MTLRLAEHSHHRQLHLSAYVFDVGHCMLQICIYAVRDNKVYLSMHETSSSHPPDHETTRI